MFSVDSCLGSAVCSSYICNRCRLLPMEKCACLSQPRLWQILISKFVYLALNAGHESLKTNCYLFSALRSLPALSDRTCWWLVCFEIFIGRKNHEVI